MFLHSQFKTITNISKQTLYIFPKTILSINISEIYKKNAYMCTINDCKINSATLITIYTNFEFISLFFLLNYRKKESFPNKYCVNFVLFQKKLSKELIKAKLALRHLQRLRKFSAIEI